MASKKKKTFFVAWPINLNLRYFVAKSVFVIYAVFGVNFILQKFCPCKRNDKLEVWRWNVLIWFHTDTLWAKDGGTGYGDE